MGARGPRKLPAATHKKRGTHRADRHGGPELRAEVPQMPADLLCKAQAAWNVIGGKLLAAGLIADLDQTALRLLAESMETYLDARDLVREQGMVVGGGEGGLYQHPAVGIMNKAWAQIVKLAREFGMTPSARCGMKIEQGPDEEDVETLLGLKVI